METINENIKEFFYLISFVLDKLNEVLMK